jgi:hypothetical protein
MGENIEFKQLDRQLIHIIIIRTNKNILRLKILHPINSFGVNRGPFIDNVVEISLIIYILLLK